MRLVLCKTPDNLEFVLYSLNDDISIPEESKIQLQDIKIEDYPHTQIMSYIDLQISSLRPSYRTDTKKLAEEGISTYDDLKNAYFLLRNKQLKKSLSIRKLVEQRYSDISCFF